MKKLLIVLMVIAMASFLLVGCVPTTPAEGEGEGEGEVVVPTTVAPVITAVTGVSLTSSAAQYVNRAESPVTGIVVSGTAPTYAEVKVYMGTKVAGTADVLANGTFSVTIALTELGADGAKTLYAVAKEPGYTESAKSNEVKFTLDRTLPTMASVVASCANDYYQVTFSEDVGASVDIVAIPASALNPANWWLDGFAATVLDTFNAVSTKAIKIVDSTPVAVANTVYFLECWDIVDLAGNAIATVADPAIIYGITLP